jgi:hypothetical protein
MPIGTDGDGRDDNEGPHCRNCHTGANNCYVCHSDSVAFPNDASIGYPTAVVRNVSAAYTATTDAPVANQTNYAAQSFIRQSAVVGAVGDACLDGGFSFPHRTLGKDMLKDELFGIDFDGTPIAAGVLRTANTGALSAGDISADKQFEYWIAEDRNSTSIIAAVRGDSGALEGAAAENMDSVCIDCHGDGSYWQGDNLALMKTTTTSPKTLGEYGSGTLMGWELLLKGLP